MRLCRFEYKNKTELGFYFDKSVVPLQAASQATGVAWEPSDNIVPCLSQGSNREAIKKIQEAFSKLPEADQQALHIPLGEAALRVPVPAPTKLMLLAGNYSKHIEEGGGLAAERSRTFPYVFMKPPLTTLTHPLDPIKIPEVSPDHVDWEIELGVIIGKRCKGVKEADALNYVAGYTVVNDVSDRVFRPNPERVERDKDSFFDWLHGKWHDTFCPMGPAVLPADEQPDPQTLKLTLRVNDQIEQDSTTAEMIFPVAAIVEFVSSFVTLEPGDIIATGTPSGVGAAKGRFLNSGDVVEAEIQNIGVLRNPVL